MRDFLDESKKSRIQQRSTSNMRKIKAKEVSGKENEDRLHDESPESTIAIGKKVHPKDMTNVP